MVLDTSSGVAPMAPIGKVKNGMIPISETILRAGVATPLLQSGWVVTWCGGRPSFAQVGSNMGQNGVWTHAMLTIVQYPFLDWSALLNHTDFGCDYLGGEQTISGFVHFVRLFQRKRDWGVRIVPIFSRFGSRSREQKLLTRNKNQTVYK
jgi:hypothetical protein